jgi:methionyl-tRNA formyltransferase
VADVERVPISPRDTATEIESALAAACVPLLARALPKLRDGSLEFVPQDEAAASYCRRLSKEDGALDFSQSAAVLAARINGLHPWPGCSVEMGGQIVKFGLAEEAEAAPMANRAGEAALNPGQIAGSDAAGLLIRTGNGVLRVRRLQRPGGRMLEATDFLRGFPLAPGSQLPSRPMPVLSGPALLKA